MAIPLQQWLDTEVASVKEKPPRWHSELYFNRIEIRPAFMDSQYFFTPADGVIMGAWEHIDADDNLIDNKGKQMTLRELMANDDLEGDFLVVSVFMTYYSQHQNYMPYSGIRLWEELPPVQTNNLPMLYVEKELLKGVVNPAFEVDYLKNNGRELSTVYSPKLAQDYYMVRVADYDVDNILNWRHDQKFFQQNDLFGMIRYGSATFLIIEQKEESLFEFKLRPEATVGNYVKCKQDPLVYIEYFNEEE